MDTQVKPTPAVFTPEAVMAINRAYVDACDIIGSEKEQPLLRHKLAENMMRLARMGETDAARLCSLSVLEVLGRRPAGAKARPVAEPPTDFG